MNGPKKRRWFQIHLSTAVVLMITSGVLLWANLTTEPEVEMWSVSRNMTNWHTIIRGRGWPIRRARIFPSNKFPKDVLRRFKQNEWEFDAIALNGLIALTILAALGVTLEWMIRRRERARE